MMHLIAPGDLDDDSCRHRSPGDLGPGEAEVYCPEAYCPEGHCPGEADAYCPEAWRARVSSIMAVNRKQWLAAIWRSSWALCKQLWMSSKPMSLSSLPVAVAPWQSLCWLIAEAGEEKPPLEMASRRLERDWSGRGVSLSSDISASIGISTL